MRYLPDTSRVPRQLKYTFDLLLRARCDEFAVLRSQNSILRTFALARRSAVVALATTTLPGLTLGGTTGDADTILLQAALLQNPLGSNRAATLELSIRLGAILCARELRPMQAHMECPEQCCCWQLFKYCSAAVSASCQPSFCC
jgi:hypothetical protein